MSENIEILLGSSQNVHSVITDNYQKIEIDNKTTEILEYDIRNALSATEIFDAEREANQNYRIYGRIEYLSLLNGLKLDYSKLENFFLSQTQNSKNIFNSFQFYLLKPSTGYTKISGNAVEYIRFFDVIATPIDFEIYNAGFTSNVYGDQVYGFNFNKDFDITPYVDNFGFPIMELFLYAVYQPMKNGLLNVETMYSTSFGTTGVSTKLPFAPSVLNIGSRVYGDLIEYSKSDFLQVPSTQHPNKQLYYINTPYNDGVLQWVYNPIIPFRLRYFYNSLNKVNSGSTSYIQSTTIPYYATSLGDGNYVWREIIPQGQFDPLTGLGVDYPFTNKKRYLFSPVILDISPNTNDPFTLNVFSEIKFGVPNIINTKPINDLNNIGKPCL